ncbi:MAG: DUF305 domain-containing protein [Chloroflexota bacterium]|jgi:uncharacterized protein (DUF305 family)
MQTDDLNSDNLALENDLEGSRSSIWPVILGVGLAALIIGGLLGYFIRGSGSPAVDSIDVGFARDMSVHHEQAVQMAALIYDRTEDNEVKSLAFDILTTQQGQIGIMSGWLDTWGHPWTTAGPRMTWMGMPVEGLMPGMVTAEQIASLRDAEGTEADIIFLQLMIPHHQFGVEMARAAVDGARTSPVRLLAQGMVDAQDLEVDYMQSLLQAKGEAPMPDAPLHDMSEHSDH